MTSLVVIFPILALALAFALLPYWYRRERADVSRLEPDVAADPLLERKTVILKNILDLEFEHRMGKLSDSDYASARTEMEEEAAAILDQLESAAPQPAAVEKQLAKAVVAARTAPADGMLCPKCQAPNPRGNRFCGTCGAKLEGASA